MQPKKIKKRRCLRPQVPNLGYICLSEEMHLRLAIEEKNIFTYYLFRNIFIFTYIYK